MKIYWLQNCNSFELLTMFSHHVIFYIVHVPSSTQHQQSGIGIRFLCFGLWSSSFEFWVYRVKYSHMKPVSARRMVWNRVQVQVFRHNIKARDPLDRSLQAAQSSLLRIITIPYRSTKKFTMNDEKIARKISWWVLSSELEKMINWQFQNWIVLSGLYFHKVKVR